MHNAAQLATVFFATCNLIIPFQYGRVFKPGAHPQLAKGRLCARVWFTEIVFVKVCVCACALAYLSMFVCTHPHEQYC